MLNILSGLVSGIVSGFGMGGGIILIFLLTHILKVDYYTALSTNLIFFIPTSISAILINIKNKNVDYKLAIIISVFGVIGSIIGVNLALKINVNILKKIFGIFLVLISINEIYTLIKMHKKVKNKT